MTEPLVIVRHVAAAPARVWDLWTTTDGLATWVWLDGTSEGELEHLEVRFEPHGADTNLTIVHDGPWNTPEPAAAYARGWSDTLAALDNLFVADRGVG